MIVFSYVDAAVVIGRLFILPGEILLAAIRVRKSAEVIVVVGNELPPYKDNGRGLTRQRSTEH